MQEATLVAAIGSKGTKGFTMHFQITIYGTIVISWTLQRQTVAAIDNWIKGNGAGTVAAAIVYGAAACGALLPGLGDLICDIIFTAFGAILIATFSNAHAMGLCITFRQYVNPFTIFDPNAMHWVSPPFWVDGGSWCNQQTWYPPVPNPQGPRTPGSVTDPTRPNPCRVGAIPTPPQCL